MNSTLNTIPLFVVILLSDGAMGNNPQAEYLWIEHKYAGNGKMTFPDNQDLFCIFMRSRTDIYFGSTRRDDVRVVLIRYSDYMIADLVTCSYGQSEDVTTSAPTYARGPQGQYYMMDEADDGNWQIGDPVSTSSASGEGALHAYYKTIGKKVPFTFSEQGFCMKRFPGFADGLTRPESKSVSVKLKEYAAGKTVPVELCECEYFYGPNKTHTVYYAEFPENEIYEIKKWDFKHDQNDTWVVWGFVEIVSSN